MHDNPHKVRVTWQPCRARRLAPPKVSLTDALSELWLNAPLPALHPAMPLDPWHSAMPMKAMRVTARMRCDETRRP